MEREDQSREDDIQLPVRQVCTRTHPCARSVAEMLRPRARLIDAHEAFWDEV